MLEAILAPLRDAMHIISSSLLIPTIAILLLLLATALVELGSLLVEAVLERPRIKANVQELVGAFQYKNAEEIMEIVRQSRLFRRHKEILCGLIEHCYLPPASLKALARHLITVEELHYSKIVGLTDLVARLGPMFGLMGTLIPLGPGILALSHGDTKTLSESLLVAFDTTVLGLAASGLAYTISRLRKRWYEEYLSSLEALMESLLEVFDSGKGPAKQKEQDF